MSVQLSPDPIYDAEYYAWLRDSTRMSAAAVVPSLIDIFRPQSVVDVGCGLGIWLSAFREGGIAEVVGIDGPWIDTGQLEIPVAQFYKHNLCNPLRLDRRFDIALCLEVAEHLPPEAAHILVESLTRLAPIVLFSAAIPSQGGDGHVNERWQSYWSELFAACGFGCLSDLRDHFWRNDAVAFWYRQNMLCYAANDRVESTGQLLLSAKRPSDTEILDLVHPEHYRYLVRENQRWRNETAKWREKADDLNAQLLTIKRSVAWRLYQAVRPGIKAAARIHAHLRSKLQLGSSDRPS